VIFSASATKDKITVVAGVQSPIGPFQSGDTRGIGRQGIHDAEHEPCFPELDYIATSKTAILCLPSPETMNRVIIVSPAQLPIAIEDRHEVAVSLPVCRRRFEEVVKHVWPATGRFCRIQEQTRNAGVGGKPQK